MKRFKGEAVKVRFWRESQVVVHSVVLKLILNFHPFKALTCSLLVLRSQASLTWVSDQKTSKIKYNQELKYDEGISRNKGVVSDNPERTNGREFFGGKKIHKKQGSGCLNQCQGGCPQNPNFHSFEVLSLLRFSLPVSANT